MVREYRESVTKQVLMKVLYAEDNAECLFVQFCAYFSSASVSVVEAYAIGRSELSLNLWDKRYQLQDGHVYTIMTTN